MKNNIKRIIMLAFLVSLLFITAQASTSESLAQQYYLKLYGSYFPNFNSPYTVPEGEAVVDETTGALSTCVEDYRIEGKNDFDIPIVRSYNTSTTGGALYEYESNREGEDYFWMNYKCSANNRIVTVQFDNEEQLYNADPSFQGKETVLDNYRYNSLRQDGTGIYYTLVNPESKASISSAVNADPITLFDISTEDNFVVLNDGSNIVMPSLVTYMDFSDYDIREVCLIFHDFRGETHAIMVRHDKEDDPDSFIGSSTPTGVTYCEYEMQMVDNNDVTACATHPLGFEYNATLIGDNGDVYYFYNNASKYTILYGEDKYGNGYLINTNRNTGYTITTNDNVKYDITKSGITRTNNNEVKELVSYVTQKINSDKDTYNKYEIDNEYIFTVTKNSGTDLQISESEENVTKYYIKRELMYEDIIKNGALPAYRLPYKIEMPTGLTKHIEYTSASKIVSTFNSLTELSGLEYHVSRYTEEDSSGSVKNESTYEYVSSTDSNGYNYISKITRDDLSNGKTFKTTVTSMDEHGRITSQKISKNSTTYDTYSYSYVNRNPDSKVSSQTVLRNIRGLNADPHGKSYSYLYDYYPERETIGNYVVNYTYHTDGNYLPKETTYNQNADTTVKIENILTSDKKSIAQTNVYDNDVLVKTTAYTYDSFGNVASESVTIDDTDCTFTTYTYDYGTDGGYTLTTNAEGIKDADGNSLPGIVTVNVYDSEHNLISVTDANGNTTTMTYDNLGRLLTTRYPDGTTESYTYDISDGITTYTAPNGTVYKAYFDAWGNILKTTVLFDGAETIVNEYEYDDRCNVSSYKRYIGSETYVKAAYTYDYLDRVLTETIYDSSSDEPIKTTTYTYTLAKGSDGKPLDTVTVSVSGDGNTYAQYSETTNYRGFLTQTKAFTDSDARVNSYTHDYVGNVVTATDAVGNVTTSAYDVFNNPVSITYADGSTETTSYNTLGLVSSQTNAIGGVTEYVYDNAGRVIRLYTPLDCHNSGLTKTYYDPNGNVTTTKVLTSPDNEEERYSVTDYTYDNMNRVTSSAVYPSDNEEIHTRYEYDIMGNPTKVTSGLTSATAAEDAGQTVTYEYDTLGRMIRTTAPDDMSETAQYDLTGRLISSTDKAGRVTQYTYDAFDNMLAKQSGSEQVSYTYNLLGQRTSMTDSTGTTNYAYSTYGDLTSEKNGATLKSYTYDLLGRPVTFSLALGSDTEQYSYTYDSLGRLTALVTDGERIDYTYDANSNLLTSARNGTVYSETEYNAGNLPTLRKHMTNGTEDITIYTYNPDGNLAISIGEEVSSMYFYDGVNRLVYENTWGDNLGYTDTFAYDAFGNRVSSTHNDYVNNAEKNTSYIYNNLNQLVSKTDNQGTTSYTYDTVGNMTSVLNGDNIIKSYTYDVFNRLIGANANGNVASYTYNGDNLRQTKTVNGVTTRHIYNGSDIIADIGETPTFYVRGNGLALLKNTAETQLYMLTARGDIRKLVNIDGTVTDYIYNAYGESIGDDTYVLNPFGYTGEYQDLCSGLIYLRNRYYDPSIGRFISEDPIKSGTNWYVYCENNPIRYTDSFGLDKNLDDYINANYAGKMTVTVAISRPVPNSRAVATINSSGMLDNGHSFLRLDDGNGNVKYLGLAPTEKSLTKMLLAEDVGGKMVDDSLSPWNVARVFELNSDQYNDLSAFLSSAESSTPNYNIRDYNCTTFAVEGLKKAGINSYRIGIYEHSWTLPDNLYEQLKGYSARGKIPTWIATAAVWTMGRFDGYTPADAAQDLKGSEGTTLLQYDSTGVKTIQNQVYWSSK